MHLSSRLRVWRREVMYNSMQPLCTKNNVHAHCDDAELFWCWKVAGGRYKQKREKKVFTDVCQSEQLTRKETAKLSTFVLTKIWKYVLGVCPMASPQKAALQQKHGGIHHHSHYKHLADLQCGSGEMWHQKQDLQITACNKPHTKMLLHIRMRHMQATFVLWSLMTTFRGTNLRFWQLFDQYLILSTHASQHHCIETAAELPLTALLSKRKRDCTSCTKLQPASHSDTHNTKADWSYIQLGDKKPRWISFMDISLITL